VASLLLIVYVPALHRPFGAFALPLVDRFIVSGAALTVAPVLEAAKALLLRARLGEDARPSGVPA